MMQTQDLLERLGLTLGLGTSGELLRVPEIRLGDVSSDFRKRGKENHGEM